MELYWNWGFLSKRMLQTNICKEHLKGISCIVLVQGCWMSWRNTLPEFPWHPYPMMAHWALPPKMHAFNLLYRECPKQVSPLMSLDFWPVPDLANPNTYFSHLHMIVHKYWCIGTFFIATAFIWCQSFHLTLYFFWFPRGNCSHY